MKIAHQPAYVLHALPYKETSLLVELLTRDHGRVSVVARGARRPRAAIRGVLLPFAPLEVGWFGKGEVRTLADADWVGGVPQLAGTPLLSGFYLNELSIKLIARDDPHPELFDAYDTAVRQLAGGRIAPVLRRFELDLLAAIGYAPMLEHDAAGAMIAADHAYRYLADEGAWPLAAGRGGAGRMCNVSGATLLALAVRDLASAAVQREARVLLRMLLDEALGGAELATRELLHQVAALAD